MQKALTTLSNESLWNRIQLLIEAETKICYKKTEEQALFSDQWQLQHQYSPIQSLHVFVHRVSDPLKPPLSHHHNLRICIVR